MSWNFFRCSFSLENNQFLLKVFVVEHENSCKSRASWHHTSINNDLCTKESKPLLFVLVLEQGKKRNNNLCLSALWIKVYFLYAYMLYILILHILFAIASLIHKIIWRKIDHAFRTVCKSYLRDRLMLAVNNLFQY